MADFVAMRAPPRIPDVVLEAISRAELPCFVYDAGAAKRRARMVTGVVDRYYYPIKACPEVGMIRAVLETGCGLDLCSAGDLTIADKLGCPGKDWKFTAALAGEELLRELVRVGARLDADSLEQGLAWGECGGKRCGLRIRAERPKRLYGAKFGMEAREVVRAVRCLTEAGVRVNGLHVHDQHGNLSAEEFGARLAEVLEGVDGVVLRGCEYINIGGSWPMRHGNAATAEELGAAMKELRGRLAGLGYNGPLVGEPGRWVTDSCGYWASRVAAIKAHPGGEERRVVVLDTIAPIPNRKSLAPFVVLRGGEPVTDSRVLTCDIFGAANTALDCIGAEVRLPQPKVGDVVVALGQGAYTRSLIPPFNERARPAAVVVED